MSRIKIILFGVAIALLFSFGEENNTTQLLLDYTSIKYPNAELNTFIYVGIKRQKLYYIENGEITLEFEVSTAKQGAGCKKGSEKTPIGLHEVRHKFGDDVPMGGIFNHKRYSGDIATINQSETAINDDHILTRVMSLRGLEEGINKGEGVDSYARAIYIHGTADEGLIGKPASHGCVRMRNDDVVTLFNAIEEGVNVILFNN